MNVLLKVLIFFSNFLSDRVKGFLAKELIGKHAVAIIAATPTGLFAVDPEDWTVGRSLLVNGHWGASELGRIWRFVSVDSTVLVVGAHVGTLAIPLAKRAKFLIAIEANPKTFHLLQINFLLNKITNHEVYNLAASDQSENINFVLSRVNSGGSKREPLNREEMYYYDQPETINIPAVSLDDLLMGKTVDFVLMDIEGSEYFALKGMPNILNQAQAIQVEFLPHHLKNVSGVTPEQFAELFTPYFDSLEVPSLALTVDNTKFAVTLRQMYEKNQGDEGLIFQKPTRSDAT